MFSGALSSSGGGAANTVVAAGATRAFRSSGASLKGTVLGSGAVVVVASTFPSFHNVAIVFSSSMVSPLVRKQTLTQAVRCDVGGSGDREMISSMIADRGGVLDERI